VKQSRAMWRRVLDSELLSAAVDHPSQSTQRTTYSLEVLRPRTVDAALVWTRQQSTRHTHDSMPSASPSVCLSVCLSVSISPELHTSDPHQRYLGPWLGRQQYLILYLRSQYLYLVLVLEGKGTWYISVARSSSGGLHFWLYYTDDIVLARCGSYGRWTPQQMTSLRRRAQANAPAASYWLRAPRLASASCKGWREQVTSK